MKIDLRIRTLATSLVGALIAMLALAGPALAQEPTETPEQSPAEVCNDGIDNDSDGDIDYPNDPGCDALADGSEDSEGAPVADGPCNDGADNDGDGRIDYPNDPGCRSLRGDSEGSSETVDVPAPRPPDRATTVRSSVAMRFDPRYGFRGQVRSSTDVCERNRKVTLFYGSGTLLGFDGSSAAGKWGVPIFRPGARHYVTIERKVIKTKTGEQIVCRAARSETVGI